MTKEQVFLAALELSDEAARAAYLDQACGDDKNLRWQVDGLLSAHFRSGDFLDRPAAEQMAAYPVSPHEDATVSVTPGQGTGPDCEADELQFLGPAGRPDSLGRIGHYEVLQVLGKGGFGIVFRAFDEALQRVVAVKVLAPSLAVTSPARKRFLREARYSAAIRHENVVQVHAVEEQPLPFLVMDFIPGETLQQRLDRTGPLDLLDILRIGRQVAEGLAAAHAQDLIHRDVKPANVLIESGPNGRIRLTDFGLARAADDASLSQSGVAAGTPLYMAPEQARGDALDHRADLFSLGSVLYVLCTGRPPFRANNTLAILKRVAEDTPRPIRQVISEVPDWLCHIVEKLHAKDPAQRFQSAREVADVLANCEAQVRAHRAPHDFNRIPGGQPRRLLPRIVKWAAAAALLAVLGVALAWWRGWVTGLFTRRDSGVAQHQTPHSPEEKEPPTRSTPPPPLAVVPFDAEKAKAHQQAWAKHLGLPIEFTNKGGLEMRVIPPGDFLMGSKESDVQETIDNARANRPPGFTFLIRSLRSETPQHSVRITRPFALGRCEVTVGQFRKFVTATGYKTTVEHAGGWGYKNDGFMQSREFSWKNVGYEQADLAPVWNVSWDDAVEFCKWLSQIEGKTYRLPTEAEWEWACRAGTATRTYWDGHRRADARPYAWGGAKSGHQPQPVGKLKPNAFGLHDMCGNVWEWCHDRYTGTSYTDDAKNSPLRDPTGPEAAGKGSIERHRVQRGGGVWGGHFGMCSTARSAAKQELVGFRVVGELATNRKPE